jgi:hypothetical protein
VPLRLPILRFFVDDTGKSLKLLGEGETRPVTFRLPNDHIAWLEEQAADAETSVNQVVRDLVFDLCTWFGMPSFVGARLEENRQQMKLDQRAYAQHLLVKRFLEIMAEGGDPRGYKVAEELRTRLAREREGSQGTPFAIRMASDHLGWLQTQAELYGLSSAGYLRLIIEDRANYFSLPPTMAARIAHDHHMAKCDFRTYMQMLIDKRADVLKEHGMMHEALHFRFPISSRYTKDQGRAKK